MEGEYKAIKHIEVATKVKVMNLNISLYHNNVDSMTTTCVISRYIV